MTQVAIFEDNSLARMMFQGLLEDEGHEVVATATNREQALELAAKILRGEIDVKAALCDMDLGSTGSEGHEVAQILRELENFVLVGISGDNNSHVSEDMAVGKRDHGRLLEILNSLEG